HVSHIILFSLLFFFLSRPHRDLHSFPTRRSSDLNSGVNLRGKVLAALANVGVPESGRKLVLEILQKGPNDPTDGGFAYAAAARADRKSTRLNSSHQIISYAVFCLKKINTI